MEPVLGRQFHVDSESAMKNAKFIQPEGGNLGKTKSIKFQQFDTYSFIFQGELTAENLRSQDWDFFVGGGIKSVGAVGWTQRDH